MQDRSSISNLPEGHNLTTATVVVTAPAGTVTPGSPLVTVLIKYPAEWKKDKFFKDGDIKEVSPETAATFVEIGIATMLDETKETPAVEDAAGGDNEGDADNLPPVTEEEGEGETETDGEVMEEEEKAVAQEPVTEVKKGKGKGK